MAASSNRRIGWKVVFTRVVPLVLAVVMGCVAFASWWFTEPLTDRGAPGSLARDANRSGLTGVPAGPGRVDAGSGPQWPEATLDGEPAKVLLLDALAAASERIEAIKSYTATFHKRERIDGKLGPEQTLEMKVRNRPFAIYLKFLAPTPGKEVVYAEGHHDNKVIAHSGGLGRLLVPRLAVAPDHPIALAGSRHSVTEAGLANLTAKLAHYRKLDLGDHEAVTVLDRVKDASGSTRLRSVHTHPRQNEDRPFARVEVLYDPETLIPIDIHNFDWPAPGRAGELPLAEHYSYENLKLDAGLTALDFDPANPAYAFHRY